jgi:hypothetical protein
MLHAVTICPMRATCLTHLVLLDFMTVAVPDEEWKLCRPTLPNCPHPLLLRLCSVQTFSSSLFWTASKLNQRSKYLGEWVVALFEWWVLRLNKGTPLLPLLPAGILFAHVSLTIHYFLAGVARALNSLTLLMKLFNDDNRSARRGAAPQPCKTTAEEKRQGAVVHRHREGQNRSSSVPNFLHIGCLHLRRTGILIKYTKQRSTSARHYARTDLLQQVVVSTQPIKVLGTW